MTYRERREARAERLRDWAAKNEAKSGAAREGARQIADNIPFGQPILVGHHSEKRARKDAERIRSGFDKGHALDVKATRQASSADEIDRQAEHAIYSDDHDAVERLEQRVADLEAERERVKAYNALRRKRKSDEGVVEDMDAAGLTEAQRAGLLSCLRFSAYACKYSAFPAYELQNLGGNINRQKKRLEGLKAERFATDEGGRGAGRYMRARFASTCDECGGQIEREDPITYYRSTRTATHLDCPVAS